MPERALPAKKRMNMSTSSLIRDWGWGSLRLLQAIAVYVLASSLALLLLYTRHVTEQPLHLHYNTTPLPPTAATAASAASNQPSTAHFCSVVCLPPFCPLAELLSSLYSKNKMKSSNFPLWSTETANCWTLHKVELSELMEQFCKKS